ncbi:MAG: spiro-SPASM protein [Spirochaetia bacterium]|nr:spiro-SPASM protein [Spirochaetia bacterium]
MVENQITSIKNEKTAILVYLSNAVIDVWKKAFEKYNTDIKADKLIENFINTLLKNNNLLFFAAEDSEFIRTYFNLKNTQNIKQVEFKHELYVIKNIYKNYSNINYIVFFDSIFPIWDKSAAEQLFSIHCKYEADYTFCENIPPGISPVFFSKSIFTPLSLEFDETGNEDKIPDELSMPLKTFVEKNINKFHAEIDFIAPDLRMLRLDFSCKNIRSIMKTSRFFHIVKEKENIYSEIEEIIKNDPKILFSFPSYLEIEINSDCEYKCDFCPRQFTILEKNQMSFDVLNKIINYLNDSIGDTSISLAGMGEPLEHPKVEEFITKLLETEKLKHLIIESNGLYLSRLLNCIEHTNFNKIKIIININSLKNYDKLHGTSKENKNKVIENIKNLGKKMKELGYDAKEKIYIQTLKIVENEDEIDEIFNLCEELNVSFLFQKYNKYISLMKERRVSDMTPLERTFCWHLRRDMFIRADGSVSFCKQDIENKNCIGNIEHETLAQVREKQIPFWEKNLANIYPNSPDCLKCDEYFTFNL